MGCIEVDCVVSYDILNVLIEQKLMLPLKATSSFHFQYAPFNGQEVRFVRVVHKYITSIAGTHAWKR